MWVQAMENKSNNAVDILFRVKEEMEQVHNVADAERILIDGLRKYVEAKKMERKLHHLRMRVRNSRERMENLRRRLNQTQVA